MSTNKIQTSFAGGELSPTLFARVDLDKFHSGAARLLNFFVDYRGGASSRPGTELIGRAMQSASPVRLIPFQFSVIQNYILEFSEFAMRIIKNGALVTETPKTLTSITQANPGVFTVPAHGFNVGDQLFFSVQGMTQVNGKEYFVANPTANTFEVVDWGGAGGPSLNTSGFNTFTSGTVARIVRVPSPYAAVDLALLKFTQSADVLTICHPDYITRDLTRSSDTAWTFTPVTLGSAQVAPVAISAVVNGGAGTTNYAYLVTAVNAANEESVASNIVTDTNKINIGATAGSVTISWNAVPGAVEYNVYKALPVTGTSVATGALFGYMTTVSGNTSTVAQDANIIPDFTIGAPTHDDPLAGNNPGTVTYDQQRKVYAGSDAEPETFWMSKPGQFKNFDISSPIQPSDAITGTLVSRQVNQIKHMVSMPNGLIMLTSGGAWQISGVGGVLSPTTIQATPQAYNGAGDVPPLTINYEILYVQQKGTIVRDLSYSFYTNIYTGSDLSVLSNHLFSGYQINEWTYAEEPFKIVWAVRSDGALLSLTYLKEQEIFGWAKHETQGRFKSVASIPEGSEDAVYFVVERSIDGELVQFIERMHTRLMPYGVSDAFCVDCGLENDIPDVDAILYISASTGTGVQFQTPGAAIWGPGSLGRYIRAAGGLAIVTTYIDPFTVLCDILADLTDVDSFNSDVVWPQEANTWQSGYPTNIFSGLDHLEGETVSILGDGNVFTPQTVVNGQVTLPQQCLKAVIGLGYTCQLQTLYLDVGEPTIQGKRKNIAAMTARVDKTRGLKMGPTFNDLTDFKDRDLNTIGQPIPLFTGDQRMIIGGGWNTEGQMCIEIDDPVPATILGVIPEITVGDTA